MSNFLRPHGLYSPWNSLGQNTGVVSLSLLQGIFPTQGSNPGLPHCRRILYQLNHKGSPRILEWVAYPFSSRSSQPRNQTGVSCIAGGFFTNRTTREALELALKLLYSVTFLMKPGSKTLLLSILKSFIVTGMQNLLTFLLYLVSSANVSFICKCKFLARKTELDPPNPVREELVLPFSTRL